MTAAPDSAPDVSPETGEGEAPDSSASDDNIRDVLIIRSAVLSMLLFLAVMYTLYFAASLLIPITLACLLSIVMSPVVRFLTGRLRLPQTLSALVVMLSMGAVMIAGVYAIADPAVSWIERAPDELQRLEYKLAWVKKPIENIEQARKQVGELTNVGDDDAAPPAAPSFSIVDTVLQGTPGLVYGVSVTLILLFFLLASGDSLLNKAVQIAPTLHDKKRVVDTGRGVQRHVSAYLATVTVINVGVGACVALAMWLLEMPNPLLWGALVGVLNYIPYIGVLVSMVIVTFVALLTFDDVFSALLPPLAIFGINVVEGQFLTPILAGRRLALSPVAVFLSLVVMGWIWGVIGVLIAVPLLATVKLVCDELVPLQPLGTFLGSD